MSEPHEDPVRISNDMLEGSGTAMMNADFDRFALYFALPHKLETFDGQRRIETTADLERVFRNVVRYLQGNGVTHLIRHCVEASYKGPATIVTTYETRMLRGTQLVQRPFPGFSVLRSGPEGWQVTGCVVAIADAPEYSRALIGKTVDEVKKIYPQT